MEILELRPRRALPFARLGLPVCLMHMQGQPRTMQDAPQYGDVVADVIGFFVERIAACEAAGLSRDLLVLDPGFGFGKRLSHNVRLLANLRQLKSVNLPVLVGLSRKSSLGALTGREVDERMPASVAAATIAILDGVDILRVHDVAETCDAVRIATAVMAER